MLTSKNPVKQRAKAKAELDEEERRFVADIPKRVHKLIRQKCLDLDIDQKRFFLDSIKRSHGIE